LALEERVTCRSEVPPDGLIPYYIRRHSLNDSFQKTKSLSY